MFFLRQIWNTLFPKTVKDHEFGTLTLDLIPDFLGSDAPDELWIATVIFAPLDRPIQVTFMIESDCGISPFQRELFHSIEARWCDISDTLAKRLMERIHEWFGEASRAEMPSTEQFFRNRVRLDGICLRSSSRRLRSVVDADLNFSVLSDALTNPSLLTMQDHYLSAQLLDGEVVGVEWH